jgi:hypothetical protein
VIAFAIEPPTLGDVSVSKQTGVPAMTLVTLRCPNPGCGNGIEFEPSHAGHAAGVVLRCRLCSEVFAQQPEAPATPQAAVIGADVLEIVPSDAATHEKILIRYGLQSF